MFTDLKKEPRALRQVELLKDSAELTVVSFSDVTSTDFTHITIPKPIPRSFITKVFSQFLTALFACLRIHSLVYKLYPVQRWVAREISGHSWDLIIAHDILTVPVASRLKSKSGFIADMHEYAPKQYDHDDKWIKTTGRYFHWLTKKYLTKATSVLTVSNGISIEFKKQYGIDSQVITNATKYHQLLPLNVSYPIKLVHSGIAASHRGMEKYIEAILQTKNDVTLDFYLVSKGHEDYYEYLKEIAKNDSRITFNEALPYAELVNTLNKYDVGISVILPTTFNHLHTLPNKFFDYIQARTAVISGPSPSIVPYINTYQLGVSTGSFSDHALLEAVDSLTPDKVMEWKENSNKAAHDLSAEKEMQKLLSIINSLLHSRTA